MFERLIQRSAAHQRRWREAKRLCPVFLVHRDSLVCQQHAGAFVSGLLFRRGPAAIFGAVIAVVVLPVYRHAMRPLAHIGKECRKAIRATPALAYLDASSAVIWIIGAGGVVTALLNGLPGAVLRRATHAMRRVACDGALASEAAATRRASGGQGVCRWRAFSAAVATALPDAITVLVFHRLNCNEPSESTAAQIDAIVRHLFIVPPERPSYV